MSPERHSEIELIVKLTASNLDLKFTKELNGLRQDLNEKIDMRIQDCQRQQRQRRRWNIGSWFSVIGLILALGSAVTAIIAVVR